MSYRLRVQCWIPAVVQIQALGWELQHALGVVKNQSVDQSVGLTSDHSAWSLSWLSPLPRGIFTQTLCGEVTVGSAPQRARSL